MSIPTQLPQPMIVTGARPNILQALALQSGEVLEAQVLGPAPNGGTQVSIRGQLLNLLLPVVAKAGETLKFEVQASGPQLRLALQMPSAPAATPAPNLPPAASAPPANMPMPQAPQVQVAPQQASAAPPTVAVQPPASGPQAPVSVTSAPVAPNAPLPTATSAPVAAAPAPAAPAMPPSTAAPAVLPPVLPAAGTVPAPVTAPVPNVPYATMAPAPTPVQPASASQAAAASPLARPQATTAPPPQQAGAATQPVVSASTGQTSPSSSVPITSPTPTTPQAALNQMMPTAALRQAPVTDLTTALTSIAGKVTLPEPVIRAARQVLAGRVALDGPKLDGAAIQSAIRGSGLFQEAALAGGIVPTPQTDMKSALLALRQTLTTWLGAQAPIAAAMQVPPPLRGSVPRVRHHVAPPIDPALPVEDIGKQLLDHTESALARTRLHQQASLPDAATRGMEWNLDLPVMIGTHQTMIQIQIHQDGHSENSSGAERGWQIRFALSLPDIGEVGAQVSFRGGTTGVMLWANEPATSTALEGDLGTLREALAAAGLNTGALVVRHGEPVAPPPASSGHFVDATR